MSGNRYAVSDVCGLILESIFQIQSLTGNVCADPVLASGDEKYFQQNSKQPALPPVQETGERGYPVSVEFDAQINY